MKVLPEAYSMRSNRSNNRVHAMVCSSREMPAPGQTRGPAENVRWRLTARRSNCNSCGHSNSSASTFAAAHGLPIVLAVAAGLVLAPLVLYLTLADE